jgi:hypothetical protein
MRGGDEQLTTMDPQTRIVFAGIEPQIIHLIRHGIVPYSGTRSETGGSRWLWMQSRNLDCVGNLQKMLAWTKASRITQLTTRQRDPSRIVDDDSLALVIV